jgi:AcrR family transcriptional regulator
MNYKPVLDVRSRILLAAKAELAAHGAAGARVDRIAEGAQTSKERMYAYFSSKDEIFASVFREFGATIDGVVERAFPDLEQAVGDLFDFFNADPVNVKLWLRQAANRDIEDLPRLSDSVFAARAEQVRAAQAAGRIRVGCDPADVLNYVFMLSLSWAIAPPELRSVAESRDLPARRAAAQGAIRAIFGPV